MAICLPRVTVTRQRLTAPETHEGQGQEDTSASNSTERAGELRDTSHVVGTRDRVG